MKVHDIMSRSVVTVTPKTSYRELWEFIFRHNVHALPVVDKDNSLLGIISEEDLLKPLYPDYQHLIDDFVSSADFEAMEDQIESISDLFASNIMSKKVIFTREHTPIMRALSRMVLRNVRQLPVLTEDGEVVGMVSKSDVFKRVFNKKVLKKKPSASNKP